MTECNTGEISKTHSPRCHKNTFSEVKFFAINIKWTKWSQHQLIDRLWLCYKFLCSIFSEDSQSIDFIKPNINLTHKVKHTVKLMEVSSCFTIYEKLENHYGKFENKKNNENQYENHYDKLENNEKLENHFFSH